MNHLKIRIPMYFIGLFVMTIGIALSVKSNLGVSPVSSIPYTMTCVWGIEMGRATILFHVALVLVQVLLLRRRFRPVQFLQIGVGIVFGCFTTFCNYCVAFLPTPEGFALRLLLMLLSTVFIAAGIFLYLPANLIPLAGEGTMQAVSTITGIEFPKVKIAFDCTMVLVSAATCLIVIHSPGSVGIGTIIAAILVGMVLGVITRLFGAQRDRLLHGGETASSVEAATVQPAPCYVISHHDLPRIWQRRTRSRETAGRTAGLPILRFRSDPNNRIRSDDFGCAQTAKLIEAAFRRKFSLAESA